jgi:hypothetical protein
MDMEKAILTTFKSIIPIFNLRIDENHEKTRQGLKSMLSGVSLDQTCVVIQGSNYWQKKIFLRFEVLVRVTLKITVFWDMTQCGLVIIRSVSEERTAYIFRRLKTEA